MGHKVSKLLFSLVGVNIPLNELDRLLLLQLQKQLGVIVCIQIPELPVEPLLLVYGQGEFSVPVWELVLEISDLNQNSVARKEVNICNSNFLQIESVEEN